MNIVTRQCLRIFKNDVAHQSQFSVLGRALAYKSALSLENFYPTSNMKLYTPTFVPEDPKAKFTGYIPMNEIEITYSRSSGAGGQNVNKVNSKVDVRFNVRNAKWISDEIKEKLIAQNESKINREGYLIIRSELTRSQQLNLADALEKLRTLIRKTLEEPPELCPETEERKRKRMLAAARERVFLKRQQSQKKRDRQASPLDF